MINVYTRLRLCIQEECARLLLFRGVNKELLNRANQTASMLATLSSYPDVAALIDNFSRSDIGQQRFVS